MHRSKPEQYKNVPLFKVGTSGFSWKTFGDSTSSSEFEEISSDLGGCSIKKMAGATENAKKEHLYKILVIGELGTGKTSIIKRYVHQFFSQHYRATIGVDFALKVLNWDAETIVRLQLWDIAGQERFGNMTRVYYREAVGCIIVFDVTRASTFDAVTKWKGDLDSKVQLADGSPVPCVLLANKCDQAKEGLVNNSAHMDEFCHEKGFVGWFETSAKENINIDESTRYLVNRILQNDQNLRAEDENDRDKIELGDEDRFRKSKKNEGGCCS
ncbi:ras-related protein Rab-38-like [Ylistrum balloti]|uniref:ras-related protein Rab-38-like n=1 Tax=Ylistrum balloti TaxID=509963 RepID=UPI0029059289|nr:ras-related protein Rab-38-like [Ylistrum balloti]